MKVGSIIISELLHTRMLDIDRGTELCCMFRGVMKRLKLVFDPLKYQSI